MGKVKFSHAKTSGLNILKKVFTKAWADANGAKIASTKGTFTITGDDKQIAIIVKQKQNLCKRANIDIEVVEPKESK